MGIIKKRLKWCTLPNSRWLTARSSRNTPDIGLLSIRRVRIRRPPRATEDMLPSKRERLPSDSIAPLASPDPSRSSDVARPSSLELTHPRSKEVQSSETDTYDDVKKRRDNQDCWRELCTYCSFR